MAIRRGGVDDKATIRAIPPPIYERFEMAKAARTSANGEMWCKHAATKHRHNAGSEDSQTEADDGRLNDCTTRFMQPEREHATSAAPNRGPGFADIATMIDEDKYGIGTSSPRSARSTVHAVGGARAYRRALAHCVTQAVAKAVMGRRQVIGSWTRLRGWCGPSVASERAGCVCTLAVRWPGSQGGCQPETS